jgi:nicotinate-nucleotide adenylyltransferase
MSDVPSAIGILGGTFDPVHQAHLHLARAALKQFGLDRILWIPAGNPPHRRPPEAASTHRLAMVRLAVAGESRFVVDDAEVVANSPSYTVPTLERLRQGLGTRQPLVLLLGADAFLGLPAWHRWRELFDLAHLAVAARPGAPLDPAHMEPALAAIYRQRWQDSANAAVALAAAPAGAIVDFIIEPVEPPDLSATAVRGLLRDGNPDGKLTADLLPPGVLDYIQNHSLYH